MENIKNPWKGLDFYRESEILYGRDSEINSLYDYISHNSQVVLYGRSGIGKSSIINAGIFPKARLDGMLPLAIKLAHDNSSSYVQQLKDVIRHKGIDAYEVVPALREEESLWEFFHRHQFFDGEGNRVRLLVVFDQFEEIFTLQNNEVVRQSFFAELADLLNDTIPEYIVEARKVVLENVKKTEAPAVDVTENELNIDIDLNLEIDEQKEDPRDYLANSSAHIVFVIREDFLSYLERYTVHIPVMRNNRFSLLPLNEEQATEVIMRPCPGLADVEVAKLIITKITGKNEFEIDGIPEVEVDAAVLSLYLSRLFEEMTKRGDSYISAELVEKAGTNIIQQFYDDCISHLPFEKQVELEYQLLTGNDRRDNISRSDFMALGFTEDDIHYLVDEVKLLRQFSMRDDLRLEFIHDILCPVVKERKEQREMQRQQEVERLRQEEEMRQLQMEAERKQREVEAKAAREKAEMEEETQRERMRNRRIYLFISSLMLVVLLMGTYYYFANIYVYKTYYREFSRINGWPVGVGKQLSEKEKTSTPLYYCLSHKGSKSPIMRVFMIDTYVDANTDVEIMSSNVRLPHKPRVTSYEIADVSLHDEKAMAYNEILSDISKIHFVEGENNIIEKEVALNEKDSILFVVNYFHINSSEMWGSFVSPKGQSMQIRENGIDRTKISLDSIGRIRSLMYYDQNGVSLPIDNGVCGYAWKYDSDNNKDIRYVLNQFSLPIEKPSNMVITKQSGDTIITQYRHALSLDDNVGVEAIGPEGFCTVKNIREKSYMYISEMSDEYSTKSYTQDVNGNVLAEQIANNLSRLVPSITNYTYNEDGDLIKIEKLSAPNTPFTVDEMDDYLYEWEYSNGKIISEIRRNKSQITYQHKIIKENDVTKELWNEVSTNKYLVKVDSLFKDGYSTSYYGRYNQPINYKVCMEEDTLVYHRIRCVLKGNEEFRFFYVYDKTEKKSPLIKNQWGQATSYYCKVIKKDNEGHIISYKELDEDSNVVKSMMFFILNGQIIGRAVEGIDGTPVRCNNWEEEGYLYYKIFYTKDFDDNFVGLQGQNEWGQISAFYDSLSGYQTVSYKDYKGDTINASQGSVPIMRSYKQHVLAPANNISSFSYPYLHILDKQSCLYNAGLKDGDRIVKFGNWTIGNSNDSLLKEWTKWNKSNKSIRIEVLRFLNDKTVQNIIKDVTCVPTSKNMHEYHIMLLTNEEYSYLKNNSIQK